MTPARSPVPVVSRWRLGATAALAALLFAACGGGGGAAGPAAARRAPALRSSPQSAIVIAGQGAVFRVEADGTGIAFDWQQRQGSNGWTPAAGQESTLGGTSELRVTATAIPAETYYRARARNAAGEAYSAEARLDVVWGTVQTIEPNNIDFSVTGEGPGSGDGGSPGGGDGDGVGAGGGLGKTPNVRVAVTRVADGASLGSALTGATSGLVRIRAAAGTAPVLLTLSGTDQGSYYDEGRGEMVPYGTDREDLHALVTAFDRHLGVTALTEAVYRYAVNHFVADPASVRDGLAPQRRSATAAEIARLTPAQIRQAHEAVRTEINRLLPPRYQLASLETLPTPVDATSGRGTLTNNRYGIMQAVTGGLALASYRYDNALAQPALAIAAQLADDLTDGVVDGFSLDRNSVFAGVRAAYDPGNLAKELTAAADSLFDLLGDGSLLQIPQILRQPLSVTVDAGAVTLSVQASGPALLYQWFTDGSPIANATSPTYSTATPGDYSVVVSNAAGSVTSALATVSVVARIDPPVITQQPQPIVLNLLGNATFSVEATGANLAYQWYDDDGPLPNATEATLRIGVAGNYYVVVSNSAGSATSNRVALSISLLAKRSR